MASLSSLTFASAALLLLLCSAGEVNARGEAVATQGKQREFDYFALALQWPGTSCQHSRRCCPTNGCCSKTNSLNDFTIRKYLLNINCVPGQQDMFLILGRGFRTCLDCPGYGLWPDYDDGTWPACCKRSNFDESQIAKLHSKLEKYWPSYSCVKTSTCYSGRGSFWAHEWEKHGTCSAPVVLDEYNYFLTTLNIFYKYNVTRVLSDAGFVPSNTEKYPLGGVIAAIQTAFHINPEVMCVEGSVQEIRLCFHKDFKPRDCGATKLYGVNASSNSCPKTVSFPLRQPPTKSGKVEIVTSSGSRSEAV